MALVPSGYRELLLCVPSWDFSTWGVLARKISNVKKTVEPMGSWKKTIDHD